MYCCTDVRDTLCSAVFVAFEGQTRSRLRDTYADSGNSSPDLSTVFMSDLHKLILILLECETETVSHMSVVTATAERGCRVRPELQATWVLP